VSKTEDCTRLYKTVTRLYKTVQDYSRLYKTVQDWTRLFKTVKDCSRLYTRLTDVALVTAVQSPVDLAVEEHSQHERVRQVVDVVLGPTRQTTVQTAVLLYWHVDRFHSDHMTCQQHC